MMNAPEDARPRIALAKIAPEALIFISPLTCAESLSVVLGVADVVVDLMVEEGVLDVLGTLAADELVVLAEHFLAETDSN